MTDLLLLIAELQRDEGWRGYLYDDANAAPIKPGTLVRGHPTIGWGFALDVSPLTQEEALPILQGRAGSVVSGLAAALPWLDDMPDGVQRAVANMAYQLGVHGLLEFTTFLSLLNNHQFDSAAEDLENTPWFHQSGDRATRIQALIRETVT